PLPRPLPSQGLLRRLLPERHLPEFRSLPPHPLPAGLLRPRPHEGRPLLPCLLRPLPALAGCSSTTCTRATSSIMRSSTSIATRSSRATPTVPSGPVTTRPGASYPRLSCW